ncbi:hypothetical protein C3941_07320 [Kaistia algarum]|uniref:SIMPL domain-containing protein n=1 Tax=Kaistia algarum TaxID=2083279 RepID=UPI000CE8D36C|nr:SIMPL domain-containing protein [Kaistia algarum]MCX5515514.1 SIMPL domain-containing protein [Kaistia algarum]PPE81083.1 hypothetical protein C3941_07320 [Kaistia algarum]
MTSTPHFKSLVAPNIFDAYADPNLLLYLVASNLLSPATWDLSDKIQKRAAEAVGTGEPSSRSLVGEIQKILDRNFQHLHVAQVAELYGEIDIAQERTRLGDESVDAALRQILRTFEARIRTGDIPPEALQPAIDRMTGGRFPAYIYGNIDLVRANRRLTGKSHASVRGVTSCVDETAIFAALAMTMPQGSVAHIVALSSPSHTSAFGWNANGEPWWFYGKNRLYFPQDWRNWVTQARSGDAQQAFDRLHEDMNRIIAVAGTFDLESGETNLPDDQLEEIVARIDAFFGVRLRQVEFALSRPRIRRPEDPLARYLRALLGAASLESVQRMLDDDDSEASQGVLYAFRSTLVKDLRPYLAVARQQPNSRRLAGTLSAVEDAIDVIRSIDDAASIFGSRNRIAMPDETLRFRSGTDRDKALLLHVVAEHIGARTGSPGPVTTLFGESKSFVRLGDRYVDAGTGELLAEPSEPIRIELA